MIAALQGNSESVNKITEGKLESKMPVFNGGLHNDFGLWKLGVEATLPDRC